jgi:four helix bundle protein
MTTNLFATESFSPSTNGMQDFTKLLVWKRAHAWVLDIYRLTSRFPIEERFGLTSQLRKSSSSVPTNIAEGSKRKSNRDYARLINIAEGSVGEAEYQLILARDLTYAEPETIADLLVRAAEIGRMLHGLRAAVEARA